MFSRVSNTISQLIIFTIISSLNWCNNSSVKEKSNKWECTAWVVGCSAGRSQDARLWPKACWVKSVSQRCFYTAANGLFPRCRLSPAPKTMSDILKEMTVEKLFFLSFTPDKVFHKSTSSHFQSWTDTEVKAHLIQNVVARSLSSYFN